MKNAAPINEEDLHAWADNRLEGARRARMETWLVAHPEARADAETWRAQSAALHRAFDAVLDEPVPSRLMETVRRARPLSAWLPLPSLQSASLAAFSLVIGVALGFALQVARAPGSSPGNAFAHQAAIAHAVFVPEVRHPVEVTADQEAHLVAWLSKRLDTALKVPQLNDAGYSLVGGRLLAGENDAGGAGAVAQFMFQGASGQRLTLYLKRSGAAHGDTGFRYTREGKVDVFYWIDEGLGCALSGEVGKDELLRVANVVYHQIAPPEGKH